MKEEEIQKMAEEHADKCFAHGSFRWQHVVDKYLRGISDYRIRLLQEAQIESEDKIGGMPSRKPYSDDLKKPLKTSTP